PDVLARRTRSLLVLAVCLGQLWATWAQPAGAQSASVSAGPEVVGVGDTVTVSYMQAAPTGNDWISIHSAGRPDSEYYGWQFAPGQEGSLSFIPPQAPGLW